MASEKFTWIDKGPVKLANYTACKGVCMFIEAEAKRRAPVDLGNLQGSIMTEMQTGPGDTVAKGTVGTNVEYAAFQEFGTKHHDAQPYLGPALELARRKYGG
jgi:HK97 gp10 family phage protein